MKRRFIFILSAFICTLCIVALHLNGMVFCTASAHAESFDIHHSAHAHTDAHADACSDESSHLPSCNSRTCCEHTESCNNSHTYIAYTKDTRILSSTSHVSCQFLISTALFNCSKTISFSKEFLSLSHLSPTISFLSTIVLRQ